MSYIIELNLNGLFLCNLLLFGEQNLPFELNRYVSGSSELRERRRQLLIDILANVDWKNFKVAFNKLKARPLTADDCYFMIAYGKLELGHWEQLTWNLDLWLCSTEKVDYVLGCLMLSALNEERVHVQPLCRSLFGPCSF